ncbi:3-phenylpropionate/trans-cinnamate dioxygenase ferredoxin reductase subunit [Stackebrandtia endophytica]|uniref:3-phenylpropionate/trans-cinnamate dioxygenase ferredoxin reductase subunit n=1 Tax=Stackebrandtia endophytica TaxID=1496996 RepID=A0A543ASD5_9ACTN|nr:FAD-dependent oxidoreductase [Stackebrandtia endophytica]TQL75493.1 3-phenylpropionate/trans-cinnamate dioxygenase ferredoxin reductase subunit [Stackebrandtia endophytica]
MTESTFIIVGAGQAGTMAAQTLREEGFSGRVLLYGQESQFPYERPPLSKGYLLGDEERDSVFLHEPSWYDEQRISVRLDQRVNAIHRDDHEVELSDGDRIGYDRLLLATGAAPRKLNLPGADLPGVHYLRELGDSERLAEALRATARRQGRVVVIGAGWIGLETTAAARRLGCEVTVIDPMDLPLRATLGSRMGEYFTNAHRLHDVDFRLGQEAAAIEGDDRVEAVVTAEGDRIPADTVIIGVGVAPRVELADAAGLPIDNGVLVDGAFRTIDSDIFAAGDIANVHYERYGRHIRVEHQISADNEAAAAARAMLGQDVRYDELPFFFTDQYDIGMEYTGWVAPGEQDAVITRGDVPGDAFYAFWLNDNVVMAGMHVNQWDVGIDPVAELIRGGRRVDPERLADPDVPIAEAVAD